MGLLNLKLEKIKRFCRQNRKALGVAAGALALVLICTAITVLAVRRHRAALEAEAAAQVETATTAMTTTTEPTTIPPTTTMPTTTEPPKPVGTTKPVAPEETKPPKREPPKQTATVCLDVPYINQRAKYPTGCESVSAVMVMRYWGMNISPEYFINNLLDKGSVPVRDSNGTYFGDDPRKVFLGNPYSELGWGCYAPVIVNAINKYIDHDKFTVDAVYGLSPDTLCERYIDNGIPVLFWATADMEKAENGKTWFINGTSETFTWKRPMHCLVLVGYNDSGYFFNDPLQSKNFYYSKSSVTAAYNALGRQAVILQKAAPKPTEPSTAPTTAPTTAPATAPETTLPETTGSTTSNSTAVS